MDPSVVIKRLPEPIRLMLYEVSELRSVHATQIIGRDRTRHIAHARHEWWARIKAMNPLWSYPFIGELTGHDHTTVMSGVRKHTIRILKAMPLGSPAKIATEDTAPSDTARGAEKVA